MNEPKQEHRVLLEDRERLTLSGITKVVGSDEQRVALTTVQGELIAEGEGLHILQLDLERGVLLLGGHIDRLLYPDEPLRTRGRSLARRLFK